MEGEVWGRRRTMARAREGTVTGIRGGNGALRRRGEVATGPGMMAMANGEIMRTDAREIVDMAVEEIGEIGVGVEVREGGGKMIVGETIATETGGGTTEIEKGTGRGTGEGSQLHAVCPTCIIHDRYVPHADTVQRIRYHIVSHERRRLLLVSLSRLSPSFVERKKGRGRPERNSR